MENLIYNIVELDGNEKYMIINQAVYKNTNYYLSNKLDENGTDLTDDFKIFQDAEIDGEKAFEIVTDEEMINLLYKYFKQD